MCNNILCGEQSVGGWNEYFSGQEKLSVKKEQMYLGNIISDNGSYSKHLKAINNKVSGIINQIMKILKSVIFGKS